MKQREFAWAMCIALCFTVSSFGQALSGTVVGTITDPTGAAVAGAVVRVANDDTGLVRSIVTNTEGKFRADTFPTGAISITIEQAGFEKLVRTGLRLPAADTLVKFLSCTAAVSRRCT